jgi:hypothetical protein
MASWRLPSRTKDRDLEPTLRVAGSRREKAAMSGTATEKAMSVPAMRQRVRELGTRVNEQGVELDRLNALRGSRQLTPAQEAKVDEFSDSIRNKLEGVLAELAEISAEAAA